MTLMSEPNAVPRGRDDADWLSRRTGRRGAGVRLAGGYWLLWLPVAFGSGIAGYFSLSIEPAWWIGPSALVLAGALAILFKGRVGMLAPALVVLAMSAGFSVGQWRTAAVASPVLLRDIGPMLVTGRVELAESRLVGYRLTLKPTHVLGREQVRLARLRVTVRSGTPPAAGSLVRVRAMLMPPSPPLRPGAFDFSRMAWFQQLGAVGYAVGPVSLLSAQPASSVAASVERLRQTIATRIRAALPDADGAVITALLTGDRGAIPKTVLQDMRDTGLAHLLAISGLHVGLVAGCLFALVRLCLAASGGIALRYPTKKIAAVASLAGAVVYLLLTGVTVPTQRAVIMVAFAVLAILLDRSPLSMRVLAWAAMIVLALHPESLLSPSFQMSFAAVLALIAVYELASPPLAAWRRDSGPAGRLLIYFAAIALTTIVAGLATAPFAAFHFHRLATFGLVANLAAVPVMAIFVMPLGILALLLMPLGLESLALWPMGLAIDAILRLAATVAQWPAATHMVAAFQSWQLGALAMCGIWFCLWRGPWRMAGLAACVAGAAALLAWPVGSATEIVVSDDGSRFAIRDAAGQVVMGPGRDNDRIGETWLTAWGQDGMDRNAVLVDTLRCDGLGCVYAPDASARISFANGIGALIDDCRLSAIVIARIPTRWHCRQPKLVIDRFDLAREGAHLVRLSGGQFAVQTVAQQQGQRPWSRTLQRAQNRGRWFSTSGTGQSGGPES